MRFDRQGLIDAGFEGFVTIGALRNGKFREVPSGGGVYIVLREVELTPSFLDVSTGGWFKGKNPSVGRENLRAKWIADTPVIYIGKGDGDKGLRGRLKQYIDFGTGRPVAHWGGRYTWQIEGSADFVVAWRLTKPGEVARDAELQLFEDFKQAYGSLPFANLSH